MSSAFLQVNPAAPEWLSDYIISIGRVRNSRFIEAVVVFAKQAYNYVGYMVRLFLTFRELYNFVT